MASRLSRYFPYWMSQFIWTLKRTCFRILQFLLGQVFQVRTIPVFFRIPFVSVNVSLSFPRFSGVGNQNFSSLCSGRSTCISASMYVMTSSWSVSRLSAAMSTGRIIFVSSSFRICNSDNLVSAFYCVRKICCISDFLALSCLWRLLLLQLQWVLHTGQTVEGVVLSQ